MEKRPVCSTAYLHKTIFSLLVGGCKNFFRRGQVFLPLDPTASCMLVADKAFIAKPPCMESLTGFGALAE